MAQYVPYKLDQESEIFGYYCELPTFENGKIKEPSGLCGFCNPKSIWFVNKKCHE